MINKFGERLRWLIKDKEISQKELSEKIKLAQSTISEWINCKCEPKADNILLIADYFDVSTDYLLGRTEEYDK